MNKEEIIEEVKKYRFDTNEYWIVTGAALVLHGIKNQTHDVDIGCTSKMADCLASKYQSFVANNGQRAFKIGNLEIYENWAKCNTCLIDGLSVSTINEIVKLKKQLNRPKDLKDLELIQKFLNSNQ